MYHILSDGADFILMPAQRSDPKASLGCVIANRGEMWLVNVSANSYLDCNIIVSYLWICGWSHNHTNIQKVECNIQRIERVR